MLLRNRLKSPMSVRHLVISLMVTSGCSSTAFGPPSLGTEVQSAVSSGHVTVYLDGTTAFLSGRVDSLYDRNAAENAARRYEGVEAVVSRIAIGQ